MFHRLSRFRPLTSLLLSASLAATSLPAGASLPEPLLPIPASLGLVTEQFAPSGASRPRVVLIEDLHLHYPTQRRILGILSHLQRNGLLSSSIGVEGAEGAYDTSLLASEPAGKGKERAVDYFLRHGELSADEAFSILQGNGRMLLGIDDRRYYDLNVSLFRRTLAARHELSTALEAVVSDLQAVKAKRFSRALKTLDADEAAGRLSPEQALEAKLGAVAQERSAEKKRFLTHLLRADHFVSLAQRLLRQEVTLSEAAHLRRHLAECGAFIRELLPEAAAGTSASSLEETLRAAADFYTVAVMRDEPLAAHLVAQVRAQKAATPFVAIVGGFHTASIARTLQHEGLAYAVVTPKLNGVDPALHDLYESRLAGRAMSEQDIRRDLGAPPVSGASPVRTLRVLSSLVTGARDQSLARWRWVRSRLESRPALVRSLPSKNPVNLDPQALLADNDPRYTRNDGESTLLEVANGRLRLSNPPTLPNSAAVTPEASLLQSLLFQAANFSRAESVASLAPFKEHPGEAERIHRHLLKPIIDRLSDYQARAGRFPRLVVSRNEELLKAQVPMVEVNDENGLTIVINGAFLDEVIAAMRNGGQPNERVSLGALYYFLEKLRHAVRHSFSVPLTLFDLEQDEVKVLGEDAADQARLTRSNGGASVYQQLIDEAVAKHRFDSVRTAFLFGRYGILERAQAAKLRNGEFLNEFVRRLRLARRVRMFPVTQSFGEKVADSFIPDSHPILRRVKIVNVHSDGPSAERAEQEVAESYAASLFHAHALAAFEAWRYAAVNHSVGKFGDKVATDAFTRLYNALPFMLETQAAEGARDAAATVAGRYGLPGLFGIPSETELAYANDPVEVTERLQRHQYMANSSIAAYAIAKLYRRKGLRPPTLRLPDNVYMLGVVGPKGSGVEVNLEPEQFVRVNLERVARMLKKEVHQVRVTGVLIRERHTTLINETLTNLSILRRHVPEELLPFFEAGPEYAIAQVKDIKGLKQFVKEQRRGLLTLSNGHNSEAGSITMMTDGDPAPVLSIVRGTADIAYGAGGVAESMTKTRAAYPYIEFQGAIVSFLATEDGKADAVQAIDPEARVLRRGKSKKGKEIDEAAICEKAGLPIENGRVAKLFTLDEITGGPYNVAIFTTPLGDPDTHEANFYPGMTEVEVLEGGRQIRVTGLVTFPSGKRSIVNVTYETGLETLQEQLKNEKDAARKVVLLTSIGRLYGDLRMYPQAFETFASARALTSSREPRLEGMEAFYRGMEALLSRETPAVAEAKAHFVNARELRHVHARMMEEVLEHGEPRTVEPAELVNAFDNVVKATEEGRGRAVDHLMAAIRLAGPEHIWTLNLYLEGMARLEVPSRVNGDVADMMNRILEAARSNRELRPKLEAIIRRLAERPETSKFFKDAVARQPDLGSGGSTLLHASLAALGGTMFSVKLLAAWHHALVRPGIDALLNVSREHPLALGAGLLAALVALLYWLTDRMIAWVSARAVEFERRQQARERLQSQLQSEGPAQAPAALDMADSVTLLDLLKLGSSRWWTTPQERARVAAAASAAKRYIVQAA